VHVVHPFREFAGRCRILNGPLPGRKIKRQSNQGVAGCDLKMDRKNAACTRRQQTAYQPVGVGRNILVRGQRLAKPVGAILGRSADVSQAHHHFFLFFEVCLHSFGLWHAGCLMSIA
jgi:hypothetical protein